MKFMADDRFAEFFDEMPIWSGPFGEVLFNVVKLNKMANVLDVGCATGFPLIELAKRFGETAKCFGIDPWQKAIDRANTKIEYFKLANTQALVAIAEDMPFADEQFDVVVSNNGLNNVSNLDNALSEIARVSKPGAQLVITYNLPETMDEFYTAFKEALSDIGKSELHDRIDAHISAKRPSVQKVAELVRAHGYAIHQIYPSFFKMRYATAEAFLNHPFIIATFKEAWDALIDECDADDIYSRVADKLNEKAEKEGEVCMNIPFACFDCEKKKEEE